MLNPFFVHQTLNISYTKTGRSDNKTQLKYYSETIFLFNIYYSNNVLLMSHTAALSRTQLIILLKKYIQYV
jgi:hypothetical protein